MQRHTIRTRACRSVRLLFLRPKMTSGNGSWRRGGGLPAMLLISARLIYCLPPPPHHPSLPSCPGSLSHTLAVRVPQATHTLTTSIHWMIFRTAKIGTLLHLLQPSPSVHPHTSSSPRSSRHLHTCISEAERTLLLFPAAQLQSASGTNVTLN